MKKKIRPKMLYLASLKKVLTGILIQSPIENKLSFSAIS